MFSKTTFALAVAIVLGTAFPALAATKHHYRIPNAAAVGGFCTAFQVAQLAVALARDLALAHHQIGGDELHSRLRLILRQQLRR